MITLDNFIQNQNIPNYDMPFILDLPGYSELKSTISKLLIEKNFEELKTLCDNNRIQSKTLYTAAIRFYIDQAIKATCNIVDEKLVVEKLKSYGNFIDIILRDQKIRQETVENNIWPDHMHLEILALFDATESIKRLLNKATNFSFDYLLCAIRSRNEELAERIYFDDKMEELSEASIRRLFEEAYNYSCIRFIERLLNKATNFSFKDLSCAIRSRNEELAERIYFDDKMEELSEMSIAILFEQACNYSCIRFSKKLFLTNYNNEQLRYAFIGVLLSPWEQRPYFNYIWEDKDIRNMIMNRVLYLSHYAECNTNYIIYAALNHDQHKNQEKLETYLNTPGIKDIIKNNIYLLTSMLRVETPYDHNIYHELVYHLYSQYRSASLNESKQDNEDKITINNKRIDKSIERIIPVQTYLERRMNLPRDVVTKISSYAGIFIPAKANKVSTSLEPKESPRSAPALEK